MDLTFKRIISAFIVFSVCCFIGCTENISPEKKALEIAKDSYVLDKDKPAYRFIEEFINEKGEDVKPDGWYVEKITDDKYLVKYKYQLFSFNEGAGEKGFFFEVDLNDEEVVDRTNEYLEKMKPLSRAYKSEKEMFNEIISEDDSRDAIE